MAGVYPGEGRDNARVMVKVKRRNLLAAGLWLGALAGQTARVFAGAPQEDLSALADPFDDRLANPAPAGFAIGWPLPAAHAHNDYVHATPLWDALGQGFTSVEADIWYADGALLLGHRQYDTWFCPRSFEQWYLQPLAAWVRSQGGQVFAGSSEPLRLLVDIKDGGARTLEAVERRLASYADILVRSAAGQVIPGAVQVVYSGEPPFDAILQRPLRYGFLDGRLRDLGVMPIQALPLVSSDWSAVGWDGGRAINSAQMDRLQAFVARVQGAGSKARLWGAPESLPEVRYRVWEAQLLAGVDVIGSDHLADLSRFLLARM